jgi:outer membrane protein TolC
VATISQPLLKNAGSNVARANVERTKLGLSIAQLNYQASVLTVVLNTETAYNTLVSARETLHIRQLSLALAQRLYDENQARRSTGVMTDLDVLTAEVGVNNARLAVRPSRPERARRGRQPPHPDQRRRLRTAPRHREFFRVQGRGSNFAASYKLARENSPEYLAATKSISQSEIDLETAKSVKLPSLNLNGSLGYNATDRSYGDAIGNLPTDHGNNWGLGVALLDALGHEGGRRPLPFDDGDAQLAESAPQPD